MLKRTRLHIIFVLSIVLTMLFIIIPKQVFGDVKPITDMQEKLEGISQEEKIVLEKLFTISQEIDELEQEEARITGDIDALQVQIKDTEDNIEAKQADYDLQMGILKQVLVSYQRGGPASYLEILLSADNLTMFLKSINMIKDISHNVDNLLGSLEEGKKVLEEEKEGLAGKVLLLEQKKIELQEPKLKKQQLKVEQEDYLNSLQEEETQYQEQLVQLEQMWGDCTVLFADIVEEITNIAEAGNFTIEDLNLSIGFFKIDGAIYEDTFNAILKEHSDLPETIFHFQADQVVIEVPEKHHILTGKFVLSGENSITFEVESGSFYELPLEAASLEELFLKGPLTIDFKKLAGDTVTIDFSLKSIKALEGSLAFEIQPEF